MPLAHSAHSIDTGPQDRLRDGAGGFIGRSAAARFSEAGWRVARFGHRLEASDESGQSCSFSGRSTPTFLRVLRLDRRSDADRSRRGRLVGRDFRPDPAADLERTLSSLSAVLDFQRVQAPQAKLIFLSSAAVYGSAGAAPIREDAALHPISPTACTRSSPRPDNGVGPVLGLDVAILRLFSVYGPGNRKQLFWTSRIACSPNPEQLELSGTGRSAGLPPYR